MRRFWLYSFLHNASVIARRREAFVNASTTLGLQLYPASSKPMRQPDQQHSSLAFARLPMFNNPVLEPVKTTGVPWSL